MTAKRTSKIIALGKSAVCLIAFATSGCSPSPAAPKGEGVCWEMTVDHPQQFGVIASDVANIDRCAANLEAVRLQRSQPSITGAYQGYFILVRPAGIYFGKHLAGFNIRALTRTEDGRLQAPALVGSCQAVTAKGRLSLYRAIEVAPCVKRLIETRCALATPTLSGQWSDESVSVTDSQITLWAHNGAILQTVGYSGCSPDVQ